MSNLTKLKSVKEFWKRNPEKRAYYNLKSNAKRRGIYFDISMSDWLVFCKKTKYHLLKGTGDNDLTIDRIFTERGYTIDNIQVLTKSENVKKQREYEKVKHEFLSNVA